MIGRLLTVIDEGILGDEGRALAALVLLLLLIGACLAAGLLATACMFVYLGGYGWFPFLGSIAILARLMYRKAFAEDER